MVYLTFVKKGAGLIDIKNAWNKENMDTVVEIWKENNSIDYVALMFWVHILDLFFMPIYGMALFSGLLLVARGLNRAKNTQKFFLWFSLSAWVVVVFDLIEEYHILVMLADTSTITNLNAFGASLSARICILVLYCGLLLLIFGGIACVIVHLKDGARSN